MEEGRIGVLGDTSLLFPTMNVLSDRGISEALRDGTIKVDDYTERQIQPASFDLRIGRIELYDQESARAIAEEMNNMSIKERLDGPKDTKKHAKVFEDSDGIEINIPPLALAEISIHEKIETPYEKRVDLRSSRGRMGLEIEKFDGEVISLRNYNPNVIRLYGQTPFAQMFFHPQLLGDGHIVRDFDEAKEIGEQLGVVTNGPYLMFQLGEFAFRYRDIGLIDSKNPSEDLYDKVKIEELELGVNETIITQLEPRIELPANIAIQLIDTPLVQYGYGGVKPSLEALFIEPNRSNAGLVDPGYFGNVTAHLRRTKSSTILNRGDNIIYGVISKFDKNVLRPYGSEGLGSHYQGSSGTVSRS